ncbi:MAG: c-type cytochrome [Rhodobacterales bacterium]|nr:c-type cytochrome [Rhodobacterales bacterium]
MKAIKRLVLGIMPAALALTVAIGTTTAPTDAVAAAKKRPTSEAGMLAWGGLLYDKWYKITEGDLPSGTHPSYPEAGKKKKSTTWRCKECHGWDYKGADGQYAKGSHFTGVKGITGAAGKPVDDIVAVLKDKTHQITGDMFSEAEFKALATYVSKGQIDISKYISADNTKVTAGDAARGKGYYETICGGCHGVDGQKMSDMPPVGSKAQKDPTETLHKIRFGQPGEEMPAMIALPLDVSIDILAYTMTLPAE